MGESSRKGFMDSDRNRRCITWLIIICVAIAGALAFWSGFVPFYPA